VAGLFTLDSESLGVLDSNALGGFGTGFVVGSVTSAGSVSGSVGLEGSASGTQSSSGSVTGRENNTGTVTGFATSTGSVTGRIAVVAVVDGTTVTTAAVTGAPGLSGSVTGSGVSAGSVTGTKPTPPTPPAPQPTESGGARWWYWPAPKIVRNGRTRFGRNRSRGTVTGAVAYTGSVDGTQQTQNVLTGFAHIVLPVFIAAPNSRKQRRQAEEELLMWLVD
jgi:hypothetical protein